MRTVWLRASSIMTKLYRYYYCLAEIRVRFKQEEGEDKHCFFYQQYAVYNIIIMEKTVYLDPDINKTL